MVNEGISWKNFLIGLGIVVGLNYSMNRLNSDKTNTTTITELVNDVNNQPSESDYMTINTIKGNLINDINSEKNLDKSKKIKVINDINDIDFIFISTDAMESFDHKNTLGCYFTYMTNDNKYKKVILIDKNRLKDTSPTIYHELRHLVDESIGDKIEYSKSSEIVKLLDKDIVSGSEIGKKKLKDKVTLFINNKVKLKKGKVRTAEINSKVNDLIGNIMNILLDNQKYKCSPNEIYVRFHGMKRFMIDNGYLKDMNDEITQDMIIRLSNDSRFMDGLLSEKIDFFELVFYMNVDLTGKTKSDMTKANSIVMNYADFKNNNNV